VFPGLYCINKESVADSLTDAIQKHIKESHDDDVAKQFTRETCKSRHLSLSTQKSMQEVTTLMLLT
jgi:hypothetical protein